MNEDQVVAAVSRFLEREGWTIVSQCSAKDRGIDIVAKRDGVECFIEAKGSTSSMEGSARFGKPFTKTQVFDRVAKGFYTAACLRQQKGNDAVVGLALPDESAFRDYAAKVAEPAAKLQVSFYWVRKSGEVAADSWPAS